MRKQLDPSAGTLLKLAICEERLGKLVEAHGHIQEVLAQLPADDPRLPVAKEQAASIDRRVPRLSLQLSATAPPGTGVRLDGNPVSADALGAPIPMNPGRHVVVVGAPGHQPREWIVELAEGERKELALSPAQNAVPQSSARADQSQDNTTAYILLGAGACVVEVSCGDCDYWSGPDPYICFTVRDTTLCSANCVDSSGCNYGGGSNPWIIENLVPSDFTSGESTFAIWDEDPEGDNVICSGTLWFPSPLAKKDSEYWLDASACNVNEGSLDWGWFLLEGM